jgi:hypothetical protein
VIDVVTNLLGEIVEIYTRDLYDGTMTRAPYARGTVCAVYFDGKDLVIVVEHNLGESSLSRSERTNDGAIDTYSLREIRVRVVQRCGRCSLWDQKVLLSKGSLLPYGQWDHKAGEGCKSAKVLAEIAEREATGERADVCYVCGRNLTPDDTELTVCNECTGSSK